MPPSQEERTWAAIAHATILLAPWTGVGGVVASFFIWLEKREDSPYIAWQGLQAWAYQGLILLAYAGLALAVLGLRAWVWELVILGAVMLPFLVSYGCYGAYACAQGGDFRYVLIGRLLRHRRG